MGGLHFSVSPLICVSSLASTCLDYLEGTKGVPRIGGRK